MARSTRAALSEHLAVVQLAATCITTSIVMRTDARSSGLPTRFQLTPGPVVALGRRGLSLRSRWTVLASQDVTAGGWTARTAWYHFDFYSADGREFLAFHLHPAGASRVIVPHAHILEAPGAQPRLLDRAHIPTPALSFSDVVRFAITDLGVEPRRADWDAVLTYDGP